MTTSSIARAPGRSAPDIGVAASDAPAAASATRALRVEGFDVTAVSAGNERVLAELGADGAPTAVVIFCPPVRVELTRQVKLVAAELPDTPLVAVLPERSGSLAPWALRAGAAAVVIESELADTLALAVSAACAGLSCVPATLRRHLVRQPLSSREKQILACVVTGLTNAEIARKLFLAESTVKTHLSSAFVKLGVHSRNEASALILDPASGVGAGILALTEPRSDTAREAA